MVVPSIQQTLNELRKEGKLIPFIGAGLSMRLGLPAFSSLIDIIAVQLGYDPEVYRMNGNYWQLAEYYVAVKGSIGPLRSEMDRLFDPSDERIQLSKAHTALTEMKLPLIYTTNYDRIIERAFELKNKPCYTVTNIDDMAAAPADATQVIKFHGAFSDDSSLVLTESSYFERLEFESAMDIKLRADMLGKSLLFVGYSLNDINIRYMLYKLHKLRQAVKRDAPRTPSAYLITFGSGEIQKTLLARWNVDIIELDPINKQESIDQFLEALV
jgi:NAD-dependent SIR2 family protein deacetylase